MSNVLKKLIKNTSYSQDQQIQMDIALNFTDEEILNIIFATVNVLSKNSSFVVQKNIAIVDKKYFLRMLKELEELSE
jgi:hypothetical protein